MYSRADKWCSEKYVTHDNCKISAARQQRPPSLVDPASNPASNPARFDIQGDTAPVLLTWHESNTPINGPLSQRSGVPISVLTSSNNSLTGWLELFSHRESQWRNQIVAGFNSPGTLASEILPVHCRAPGSDVTSYVTISPSLLELWTAWHQGCIIILGNMRW